MKNAIRTFAMLLALGFTTSAFAVTTPTMSDQKSATGTFKCTIIKPLSILENTSANLDLGEILQGETKTFSVDNKIDWNIEGNDNHTYLYKIEEDKSEGTGTGEVTLELTWTKLDASLTDAPIVGAAAGSPAVLSATGKSKITATVTKVIAGTTATLGETSFVQKVTVAYSGL